MSWTFNDTIVTDIDTTKYKSFVYLIERLDTGKKYVGKKKLQRVNRKKVKGKKNRRVIKSDSDWREYYGSNETLKNEVRELGEKLFKRTILRLCKSLSEASYYEAKIQFENDVLYYPEAWYNDWISVRVRRAHLKKS